MSVKKERSKILIFDIENSPNKSLTWGMWEQNVIEIEEEWYMLSFAYKWLGEKRTEVVALPDFKRYKKNKRDDKELVKRLWKLLNEAEIVIGHNSDKFDIRKTNARFIINGLPKPSPYKTIDTVKVARKHFFFNSNKLNYLCKILGIGKKIKTGGIDLWTSCMNGDMKAWAKMKKYNKHDVVITEKLYLLLRPWITNHPNRALMDEKERACPTCSSSKVIKNGFVYSRVGIFQKWICKSCGAWSQSCRSEKYFVKPELK